MKTFTINTLGCKVNQYESQQFRELFEQSGLILAGPGEVADIVVVNTCCVTHTASSKSRQCIRKAQKRHSGAAIVVAGCLPVGYSNELEKNSDNIHIIDQKNDVVSKISNLIGCGADRFSQLPAITAFKDQCRAFLKVQDGCDGACTYCIIPQIRTDVCNKNVKSVLSEAQSLVAAGHKEIVLTGIFLGAYGQKTVRRKRWNAENENSFVSLLDEVAQVPGLARVRISSLEVGDVTDKLLDVMCKNHNIMPHLHLPLQGGTDEILKRMGRQYRISDFRKTLSELRLQLDRPAVTTDIIVGFPGESDEDFEQTMAVAREFEFSKIHVFRFSARKGTAAASMQPVVKAEVIKERASRLGALDKELQERFRAQFVGEKVGVLVEGEQPLQGRCERYFMVELGEKVDSEIKKGDLVYGVLGEDLV